MYKIENHKVELHREVKIVDLPIPIVDTRISELRDINEKPNWTPQYSGDIVDESYTDTLSLRKKLKTVKQQTAELTNQEQKLGSNKQALIDIDKSKKPKQDGGHSE